LSIAVWVGIIALAGLEAEMGVVLLLYLQIAHQKWQTEGRMRHVDDLKEAIHYGAVQRLRPKLMTVLTTFVGLLPIMWASTYETGADVMKRMAAPMVGGLVTSFFLGLTIYPAVFFVWKRYEMEGLAATLRDLIPFSIRPATATGEIEGVPARQSRGRLLFALLALLLVLLLLWGLWSWRQSGIVVEALQPVAQKQVGDIQIEVSAPEGRFRPGQSRFHLTFRNLGGDPVEVENVKVQFYMPAMATMPAMLIGADVSPIIPDGIQADVDLPMSGEWQMRITFDTPEGSATSAGSQKAQISIRTQ
ncbi:efflux RND transporter permease subunit, partial [Acidobacteria bacterium AH-259-G07]|nr:efflux RND transporter permease subunit [Acidobacteria bacterium AH-259-G07]